MNTGTEAGVVADFVVSLEAQGWTVTTEVGWADVVAERGAERLIAEAKGLTSAVGLDVDTMFGRLLRRTKASDDLTRYAVVVPEKALPDRSFSRFHASMNEL